MDDNTALSMDFETDSGNQYIYDGVTNRVMFAPDPIPRMVKNYKAKTKAEIFSELMPEFPQSMLDDYYHQVQGWVDIDEAFYPEAPIQEESVTPERDALKRKRYSYPGLILVVTNQCNLKCNYCLLDTVPEAMSFETAKAAIDLFLEANANVKEHALSRVTFNFYGGEPLLEFDLLKRCVDYIKTKTFGAIPVVLLMTTNGTLLTDEIISFLAENDFAVSISLDGPKEEHDRNRTTKANRGTYDKVLENLMRYKAKYPEHYKEKVGLIATFDFDTDVEKTLDWFYENRSALPPLRRAAMASVSEKTCSRFGCDTMHGFMQRQTEIHAKIKTYLAQNPISDKMKTTWSNLFFAELTKMCDKRHNISWKMSRVTCWPGVGRMTVHPDGSLHVCEKIASCYPLGSVHSGIDIEKVNQVVTDYVEQVINENECYACIAQHNCELCYANTIGAFNSSFSCKAKQAKFKKTLEHWYSLFEVNPELIMHGRLHKDTFLDRMI